MPPLSPIIIVDDDKDDQDLIRQVCERLNIKNNLIVFENGEDVYNYLLTSTEQPFLILCDINMPMIDGLHLRRRIEQDEVLKRKAIPFVFLTTSASKRQVNEAYSMTIQGFFEKGDSFEKLTRRMELIMEYWKDCKHPNSV
ncbi:MAG: response regulator [Chryseolinea sp.]